MKDDSINRRAEAVNALSQEEGPDRIRTVHYTRQSLAEAQEVLERARELGGNDQLSIWLDYTLNGVGRTFHYNRATLAAANATVPHRAWTSQHEVLREAGAFAPGRES